MEASCMAAVMAARMVARLTGPLPVRLVAVSSWKVTLTQVPDARPQSIKYSAEAREFSFGSYIEPPVPLK